MLEIIFGIIILGIAVYIALRVVGNIAIGIILIGLVLLASYLLIGGFPNLQNIPIIGHYLPKMPGTTGEAIAMVKNALYSIKILSTGRDSQNDLLITLGNTGKLELSNFTIFVDNEKVNIINKQGSLKSGDVTVIQVDWKEIFNNISVYAGNTNTTYISQ